MHVLHITSTDPCINLATEEHLLRTHRQGEIVLLWQNAPTIVVGRHQNTAQEVNADFIQAQGITVVRRITGGGAVYHDLGNINFSFITEADQAEKNTFTRFTTPVVQALRGFGLCAEPSGRNDITIAGYKVSGNAQILDKNRILHHGTLLFDSDLAVMEKSLHVHPNKLCARGIASVRSRVTNIRQLLADDMPPAVFMQQLLTALTQNSPYTPLVLPPEEQQAIAVLGEQKYASWAWTYGHSPAFALRNRKQFPGGGIEVSLNIEHGCIQECAFYGDYMALRPSTEVASLLQGCPHTPEAVRRVIASLPLHEYFGSIGVEELVACFFTKQ